MRIKNIFVAVALPLSSLMACLPTPSLEENPPVTAADQGGSDAADLPLIADDSGVIAGDMQRPEPDMDQALSEAMGDASADQSDQAPDMTVKVCPDTSYDAITQLTASVGEADDSLGAWNVTVNGEIGTMHAFDGETRLRVEASSSDTLGWAMMRVTVGEELLGVAHITSAEVSTYDFALPQGLSGVHAVTLSYINNMVNASGDRNLHVASLRLDCGEVITPMNLPSGASTSFCACAGEDPEPQDFESCATMRSDGVGTYYQPGPYELPAETESDGAIPQGTVTSGTLASSEIYDGVSHKYWVYTPAQYDGAEPAALMVLFDGGGYRNPDGSVRAPAVFDRLIHRGEMPVTIVVFVDPGVRANGDSNRSLEYNTPDDRNVRFILEELLPETTAQLNLSSDPARRALGGISSGGAAALIGAWERPQEFGLVYTTLGSFVQLRANADGEFADVLIERIEQAPQRHPMRISLLSGENDIVNQFGSWPIAHMRITTALDCAGYTYRSGYGETKHTNNAHPRTAFPDDIRWLFELVPR